MTNTEELLCGATLSTPDGKTIATIKCTRPKIHTTQYPQIQYGDHIYKDDTQHIVWGGFNVINYEPTEPEPQNYEDNYSSTQTINEKAYKRLTELLDAAEDEYTRSDKEQPTPQEGDIWVYTKFYDNTCPLTLIVSNVKYENTNGTPPINYFCIDGENGLHYDYTKEELNNLYTLVWRDGKRWDGA